MYLSTVAATKEGINVTFNVSSCCTNKVFMTLSIANVCVCECVTHTDTNDAVGRQKASAYKVTFKCKKRQPSHHNTSVGK